MDEETAAVVRGYREALVKVDTPTLQHWVFIDTEWLLKGRTKCTIGAPQLNAYAFVPIEARISFFVDELKRRGDDAA